MLKIGSHISSAKGFEAMGKTAVRLNATAFAFFTRNPRGGKAKAIDEEDVKRFQKIREQQRIEAVVAHAPYTMNACAARSDLREFAENIMRDDLQRMEYLPGNFYNFHPGSHVGQGIEEGVCLIAECLNRVLTGEQSTTVLLETMAGKGSEVGGRFEELRMILDRIERKDKMGICLDTCHVWDAGYDIAGHLDEVLEEFDRVIGLPFLRAVHLNDSMNPQGAHKDRHDVFGKGTFGLEAIVIIINHPLLRYLPFILETPNDEDGWAAEIALLRSYYREVI